MHEYLKDHIHEEIEGAIDYMTKALELKTSHPALSAKFVKMSDMEAEHANCLTKMFNSIEKPDTVTDKEFATMMKSIISDYTESMGKIESMKKLYWSN